MFNYLVFSFYVEILEYGAAFEAKAEYGKLLFLFMDHDIGSGLVKADLGSQQVNKRGKPVFITESNKPSAFFGSGSCCLGQYTVFLRFFNTQKRLINFEGSRVEQPPQVLFGFGNLMVRLLLFMFPF